MNWHRHGTGHASCTFCMHAPARVTSTVMSAPGSLLIVTIIALSCVAFFSCLNIHVDVAHYFIIDEEDRGTGSYKAQHSAIDPLVCYRGNSEGVCIKLSGLIRCSLWWTTLSPVQQTFDQSGGCMHTLCRLPPLIQQLSTGHTAVLLCTFSCFS